MTRSKTLLGLIGWLLLCFAPALLGARFMPGEWYAALQKPAWNPPGWIFGPVWSALYTMMAVAAWLVWKRGGFAGQSRPLGWFLAQLILNAAWTPLFFGLHRPDLAFAEILLLWLAIGAVLNLLGVLGWIYLFSAPSQPDPDDAPAKPKATKKRR